MVSSALLACSSDEQPPRSASYSDGTTTQPSTPSRDPRGGDGNDPPLPPAAPPRERPTPDSDSIQEFGDDSRPDRDAGASAPEADAGADADSGTN